MWRQILLALSLVLELGLILVFGAVLGWRAGFWLEERWGPPGLASAIGVFLGVTGGLLVAGRLLFRMIAGGDSDRG